MDKEKLMENAREDLMHMYCLPCGEFKVECIYCGGTFCVYCEMECPCHD